MAVDRDPVVALLSLEPWDEVWRRNQHLSAALLDGGHVREIIFVEPVAFGLRGLTRTVSTGLTVVAPPLPAPRRAGGLFATAAWLHTASLRRATHLWVNYAPLGVPCLRAGRPTVYDVTDDWRDTEQPDHVRHRLVAAETRLAPVSTTVVCSPVLRDRWRQRYGVEATLVPNAIDAAAWQGAIPRELDGAAPHVGYVGTLHDERLDVDLVEKLARRLDGSVHLVGPDHLREASRARLLAAGVRLPGPVPAADVPSWTAAMDVLLSPHLVTGFTLSLDAIKAHEYAASGRPVVATPTSGFQDAGAPGVHVAQGQDAFITAVLGLVSAGRPAGAVRAAATWAERAADFSQALLNAPTPGRLAWLPRRLRAA